MRDDVIEPSSPPDVVVAEVGSLRVPLIVGHQALRAAARDWSSYTSNTPFRVPIPEESDLRDVQQFPIETDPPEHRAYRDLLEDRFSRAAADRIRPAVEEVTARVLASMQAGTSIRVVEDLAIPVVAAATAHTLGRPDDADRIASWGVHVFTDPVSGERRRNADVDAFIAGCVDDALAHGSDDLFGDLARAEVFGRRVTRDEMLGVGSLVLAGGRDTVINAIVGALWFLANHPAERVRLRDDPGSIPAAVEELLRYFSPLAFIGRTVTADHTLDGCPMRAGEVIGLGFAAANHDERAFDGPERVQLERRPNRHVAFGHGPHTCIGAPLARMETSVVVEQFVGATDLHATVGWSGRPVSASMSSDWIPRDLMLSLDAVAP